MDLRTYLSILNRQRVVIIGTLLFALLAAFAGTFLLTPKYQAAATLRFSTAISGSTDYVQYNIDYTDRLMNTYSELATGSTSTSELVRQFQLAKAPEISVKIIANSELMQLWVTHEDPQLVAQMANSLGEFLIREGAQITDNNRKRAQEVLLAQIANIQSAISDNQKKYAAVEGDTPEATEQRGSLSRTIGAQGVALDQLKKELDQAQLQETLQATTISVVDPAVVPGGPSSPNFPLNMIMGLVAGLVGGLGIAFLLENFDTQLRTAEQIQTLTDLPLLVEIPASSSSGKEQNNEQEIDPAGYAAFRRLSVNVISRSAKPGYSSFLVTSSEQLEGRSTVVANLAWALSESGRRVIVVDSDFQSPTIHTLFGLPNHIGLSNILQEQEWLVRQRTQPLNGTSPILNRMGMGKAVAVATNGVGHAHELTPSNGMAVVTEMRQEATKEADPVDIASILNKSLEVSIANSLQRSMIPGVQVLATGPLTLSNPAQLLSTVRFTALMEQLHHHADVVLVDAPAYMSATYTSTLASVVDAVVFVVGYGRVKQDVVKDTLSQLETVNPNILGIAANWANQKKR